MKKEWLLTLGSAIITVVIALALVRWIAPGLLGYAPDQQLVRVSEEVPNFYENIFRDDDYNTSEFILNDPQLVIRAKPLYPDTVAMGPNDVLGFRNKGVPNRATIVVIGDSQTYGNNARLEENWPSHMQQTLFGAAPENVYNMSVGGWGGVNYLRILDSALRFNPQVIVVAYYSGNDAYTDFRNTYSIDELSYLRTDPSLSSNDLPEVVELRSDQLYPITFEDGVETIFTPQYRFAPNDRSDPAILAGYDIMAATAREITQIALEKNIRPVFTIIPTKEYVYQEKIAAEPSATSNAAYQQLIRDESLNIEELEEELKSIEGALYIDVAQALMTAALTPEVLYPPNVNGHPLSRGYQVIGETIASAIADENLVAPRRGLHGLVLGDQVLQFMLLTNDGMWTLESRNIATENGWAIDNIPRLGVDEITNVPYLGVLEEVDPERYGPDGSLINN